MKRLKIAEQLLIVLAIAVLLPLGIAGVVVTNVNQHAVRKELQYSATIIADSVYQRLVKSIEEKEQTLAYIAEGLNHVKKWQREKYFSDISAISNEIETIKLDRLNFNNNLTALSPDFSEFDSDVKYDKSNKKLIIFRKLNKNEYISEKIDLKKLADNIFKPFNSTEREVYIIDSDKNRIMSLNHNKDHFKDIITYLPQSTANGIPVIFSKIKNQPKILINIKQPEWSIIVSTPRQATNYSIVKARFKIIMAIVVAAFSIILLCAGYTYSLYTNIRQLIKAIKAIELGNYNRRIRLIKDFFTPFETIFLAKEFNKMTRKINDSYKKLQASNEKLKKMDEYKSNLIDTVSHELRTPLTSIKGYTSRLLRHDVQLDEETKVKSLKVIKQQSERLSRMVEDLLVIPDIESSLLRVIPEEINLKEIIETSILSVSQKRSKVFNFSMSDDVPNVYADPDRVEQIIINLLENAVKYSFEESEINIKVKNTENLVKVSVQNNCEPIASENIEKLFEKFTRVDENMTRTTRGTGLGLFIVKGLVEAMNGEIKLKSENGFEVEFTLPLAIQESALQEEQLNE